MMSELGGIFMLKNMKKIILIILIIVVSAGIGVFAAFQKKGKQIELPDEEKIVRLQLNSFRIVPGYYDNYDLWEMKRIKESIEKTKPLSKEEAMKHPMQGKPYVLGLIYEDEERYFFKFYKDGEKWFMKTKNGDVYANADFIEKHVTKTSEAISNGEAIDTTFFYEFNFSREMYEYGEKTDFDTRYLFAATMKSYKDRMSFAEAIDATMLHLKGARFLYQYAIDNGCEVTDEEVEKGYLEHFNLLPEKDREEFEEKLAEALQKEGISKELYDKCARVSYKTRLIMEKLDEKHRQEFMEGTDDLHLKGQEYRTDTEYAILYRNYLLNIASESKKYEGVMKKIDKELEVAKQAYIEYFGTEGFLEKKEKEPEKIVEEPKENEEDSWLDEYLRPWVGKWVSVNEDSTFIVNKDGTCELDGETYTFRYTREINGTFNVDELIKKDGTTREYRDIAWGLIRDGQLWMDRTFGKIGETYYNLETRETNEK